MRAQGTCTHARRCVCQHEVHARVLADVHCQHKARARMHVDVYASTRFVHAYSPMWHASTRHVHACTSMCMQHEVRARVQSGVLACTDYVLACTDFDSFAYGRFSLTTAS